MLRFMIHTDICSFHAYPVDTQDRRFYPLNSFRSLLGISGRSVAPTYEGLYSGSWQHPRCSRCFVA